MIILYIFIAIAALVLIVVNLPVFGSLPSGLRLNKIRHLPNYRNGAIQNLSPTPMQPEGVSFFTILKAFFFEKHPNKIPKTSLKFVEPALDAVPEQPSPEIIWFGHSSYLIKVDNLRILVDPVFSKVPSPFSFIGSKAFAGTDFVNATQFKNIDILLITHDHYDHMDYQTILSIAPHVKKIVTSIGVGAHLERWGIPTDQIHELCWNETISLSEHLKFTAVPARHFTGRKFKRNQTLWSAFVLETSQSRLFLGGDSGYDTHFAEIGKTYGSFDLAILECGQYDAYWPYIHMFPEETVKAAIDLKAEVLMPVHWGKFSLSMHPWNEPINRIVKAAKENGVRLVTPRLGETIRLDNYLPNTNWWLEE
ncbi:L-ascorbate metabolism protein UlaG (beta-lactamase superfamily) [Pedobacter psychrotolerans]|uniref:L-ascorbate metabolism protein UlaG (Beta-lactamase superfamily) n=1 Tax=Pedobacter psychrotolerans TaxID=1843235 RepID=A0A4R2HCX2_9SPHI|nr:MBL fold metallo-hydrolase [Pedobacter psychrotolerans]TCO25111.1 L-ascorbate metabolism protein UlaG (beta-lactamase superfamily) [Pedobacter psychrotolerans]GGE48035.1 MBL fold metallo-hydrolase [Pedobacter psychrotolerans]